MNTNTFKALAISALTALSLSAPASANPFMDGFNQGFQESSGGFALPIFQQPSSSQPSSAPLTYSELSQFCAGYYGYSYSDGACRNGGGGGVVISNSDSFALSWLKNNGYR